MMASCVVAAFFLYAGCGGTSAVPEESEKSLNVNGVERLIYGDSYAGYLVVHLDESIGARLSEEKILYSRNGDLRVDSIQYAIGRYSSVEIERSVSATEDEVDESREHLERLSGRGLADWNSIYYVKTPDKDAAAELLGELRETPGVQTAYPAMRPVPFGLESTPSLTGLQGYLYAEASSGGLNAQAAWDAGAKGDGVYLIFNESGINFDHEDLGLQANLMIFGGNYLYEPDCAPGFPQVIAGDCDEFIAHGTSGAGIVVGVDNGHGVTGFAPLAHYVNAPLRSGIAEILKPSTDGIDTPSIMDTDVEPGSIWILPVGEDLSDLDIGQVPVDIMPQTFAAIEQAIAYGVTVIVGAGNGSVNLDDPGLYAMGDFFVDLSQEDSGAITVGASSGADKAKAGFSTCGSSVDVFAWGQGVVTAGFPYGEYAWNGANPPVPPNADDNSYFVDNYGGTSAATAMIAGAAALVQSYVKNSIGGKKYLMPLKMREILVDSGVPQTDGGCNIGKQPRVDAAMELVDGYLGGVLPQFPELAAGETMTFDRMKQLRDAGVGLVCKKFKPLESDPSCPHSEIYPPGSGAAPAYDFDGDKRADLVQWTNGTWKLDLSGYGENGSDNYGAWDIEMGYPPIDAKWVLPYVEDVNGDGFCDFVVYDKEHNNWYIKYMTIDMLLKAGLNGKPWVWDHVVEYPEETVYKNASGKVVEEEDTWFDDRKMNPDESNYSRPFLTDYDGDGIPDLTIACSDGYWRVDISQSSLGQWDGFGKYDIKRKYLTDEQLAAAPGWAYLTAVFPWVPEVFGSEKYMYIYMKVPDGVEGAGNVFVTEAPDFNDDMIDDLPAIYGGNDAILVPGRFNIDESDFGVPAIKDQLGNWKFATVSSGLTELKDAEPQGIYGGPECHPVVADFDGDGYSDYTVMCPNEWRIVYSDENVFANDCDPGDGVRYVELGYDESKNSLPGQAYAGGVSYAYARQLIEAFKMLYPGEPPPIPVDLVMMSPK